MPSVSVKDVSQQDFTVALAAHFKKSGKMKVPEWVDIVKTNVGKELVRSDYITSIPFHNFTSIHLLRPPMTRIGSS